MNRIKNIETMQDLEHEIRKSRIRLQGIQFLIDREITYAQEMILRRHVHLPQPMIGTDNGQLAYQSKDPGFWQRLVRQAGHKIRTTLMEAVFSILIKQIHLNHKK